MAIATENLALIVARADGGIVRIGPIGYRHIAEQMVRTFKSMASNTTGAAGASYTIEPYAPKPGEMYLPLVPACFDSVLTAIEDPAQDADGPFPDLWSRLHAQHGHETAARIWGAVCAYMDQAAEDDEREAQERATAEKAKTQFKESLRVLLTAYKDDQADLDATVEEITTLGYHVAKG